MQPTKLWNRDFVLYWLGTAQSSFGSALAGIALSFLILELTGSAASMGVNLALSLIPGLFAPLAGNLVDRLPIKPPLVLGDVARGLIALGLWALAARGEVSIPLIYAATVLMSVIGVIYGPAASKVFPELVPKDQLARANGLLGTATQSMNFLGLVGGGVLVSQIGSPLALLVDAVSFFVMAGLLLLVRMPAFVGQARHGGFWQGLGEGLRLMARSRVLTLVPLMAFFINMTFAPVLMLIPKMMQDLGLGAQGYGFFMGSFTAGIVLGNVLVSVLGPRLQPGVAFSLGLSVMAVAIGAIGWVGQVGWMYALAVVGGAANGLVNTSLVILLQSLVAPEFRGRVFGVLGSIGQVGMPIALLLLAPVVDRLSPALIFSVAGGATLLMVAVWLVFSKPRAAQPAMETRAEG
ncbi:MFS transporter [Calidithermus chliarophilus]|uniref:MFS transporter n=1 Tax=Calidithermus chliarophilus TaxID=52023 RepID=UPI00041BFA39|nr:MFS transporter [Calidithermus chliarophilus]